MKSDSFWIRKALLCLAIPALLAGLPSPTPAAGAVSAFESYQALLTRHLVERELPGGGLVSAFDYREALAADKTSELLDEQRRRLAGFDIALLETRELSLAFWVNAYNFFMIDYILSNSDGGAPPDSVRDYGTLFNPYRVFERKLFDVGGRKYSLQEIELDVLLGESFAARGWKDARVHFMVNCASVGCPALRQQIYTAGNVEAMLAENTRRALDTPLHLERDGNTLRVTSLFDWYAADFDAQSGSLEAFIRDHGSERAKARLEATDAVEFIDYDWSLNTRENFGPVLHEAGIEGFD